jgi:CRP-like cAMP-binding protein
MPLEWLKKSELTLAELVARRRYAEAIDRLKRELHQRTPTEKTRLQLADLLVLAGREREALPLLIGLADELAAEGFDAKALALLKRAGRMAAGEPEVDKRLAALAQRRTASATGAVPVASAGTRPPRERRPSPEIGMEELGPATLRRLRTLKPAETPARLRAESEAVTQGPEGASEEPSPTEPPPREGSSEGSSPAFPAMLRRFFAALPASDSGEAAAIAEAPTNAAGTHGATTASASEPSLEAELEEPTGWVGPEELFEVPPEQLGLMELSPEGPIEIEMELGPPLSDGSYDDRILDLGLEVLGAPHAGPPAENPSVESPPLVAPTAVPDDRPLTGPAQSLAGIPLFWDLTEDELRALIHGLGVRSYEAGDILVSEGEPGESLFVLASGGARAFVRDPQGRSLPVAELGEGDAFGEISGLTGEPRTATVTATTWCDVLTLEKDAVTAITDAHPRVRDTLERLSRERRASPEARAVRAVGLGGTGVRVAAREVLRAHFGQSAWDQRTRLRLADLLVRADKADDARAVLMALAQELANVGRMEQAIAVLKKVEGIARPDFVPPPTRALPSLSPPAPALGSDQLEGWLLRLTKDVARRRGAFPAAPAAAEARHPSAMRYAQGLAAHPLFESLREDELLAVVRGLTLLVFRAGDVIITEGERTEGLFVLVSGAVKVFGRQPSGHHVPLAGLVAGSFFGEIATLAERPRGATVTAAAPCELLALEKPTLVGILESHPRVRQVLQEAIQERSGPPA